jgi:1,2-diacylglycerol 3-alpha-glucosyltransferase
MTEPEAPAMLVGQYIDTYLPTLDGVVMTVHNYARWLNQDHFACYVATTTAPAGYEDHEAYPIFRYKSMPVPQRHVYRFGVPTLDRAFVASQIDLRPSLVHAHTPFTAGIEARRLARKLKIPLVASFHSKYYDDILQVTKSRLLAETATALIVDFYNHCDHVWTVNEGTAQTLRDYGYKKAIEIMPNGTDFVFPADIPAARAEVEKRFGLAPDDKLILFVGQHILQKNLPMLLDAAALYARSGGRFKMILVGDGYAREQLEEQARQLGLRSRVIFAGTESDRQRLSSLYLRADLFTFPSLYDNAPLVIREAAMAGCPSVLVAGSNAAENTRDGVDAYHCENNAESLCQTIRRALADDQQRQAVGRRASQTIGQPWQDVVENVAERYQEIIREYQTRKRHRRPASRPPAGQKVKPASRTRRQP